MVSPVLSNILLDKLDKFVETTLIPKYTKGEKRKRNTEYRKLMGQAEKHYRKGEKTEAARYRKQAQKLPSVDTHDPDFRRLRYCRYADDVRHLTQNEILLAEKRGSEEDDPWVTLPT